MPYLELNKLTKRYGRDASDSFAVRDFTLAIEQGEFVSLLGPSGCGKTTTLRMLAGFVTPTSGTITLNGTAIQRRPPYRRGMGFVFQHYALFPHLTVAGNVEFGLRMRHVPGPERVRRVGSTLEQVGLNALAERYPNQLSGGQQQRVALARALVIEPAVLLLDEPLSNLDAALRAELRDEIRRLQRELTMTTLFVTHDQQEALALSDRVIVMNHGQVVEVAPPQTLSETPQALFSAQFLGARTILAGRAETTSEGRRVFVTRGGLRCFLDDAITPAEPSHLVLRSARLRLRAATADVRDRTPFLTSPAELLDAVYLGDTLQCEVRAAGERVRVLQPSNESLPARDAPLELWADRDAIAFISNP